MRFAFVGLLLLACSLALRATPIPVSSAPTRESVGVHHPKKARGRLPFHGRIMAIDPVAMTITLAGKEKPRIIFVTAQTRVTRDGARASLASCSLDEKVSGQLIRTSDGKEEARSLRLSVKPTPRN